MQKLYFIPGTMCTSEVWQPLIERLPDTVTCECLTIPNHLSLEEIATDLMSLLPEEKVNLIGFSLGGYIAALMASLFPERINSLIIIANSPTSLNSAELNVRKQAQTMLTRFTYKGMADEKAQGLLRDNKPEHIDLLKRMDNALGVETLKSQLAHTSIRQDLMPSLLALTCPLLFCYSVDDALINNSWMKNFTAHASANRLIYPIEGDSHMLILEEPEYLADLMKAFYEMDKAGSV